MMAATVEPNIRTAVIGARGYIGAALMRSFVAAGHSAVGVSSKTFDYEAAGAARDLRALLDGARAVVMCAIVAPPNATMTSPEWRAFEPRNARLAEMVAECADAVGAHLHYISTDSVYRYVDEALPESEPPTPTTPYAAVHAMRERLCRAALDEAATFYRLTQVYGDDEPHNAYGPCRMIRSAAGEGVIRLFGEGEDRRDHISIKDVCAYLAALTARPPGGFVNLGTGESPSFAEIAAAVRAIFPDARIETQPRKIAPSCRRLDVSRLRALVPSIRPRRLFEQLPELCAGLGAGHKRAPIAGEAG